MKKVIECTASVCHIFHYNFCDYFFGTKKSKEKREKVERFILSFVNHIWCFKSVIHAPTCILHGNGCVNIKRKRKRKKYEALEKAERRLQLKGKNVIMVGRFLISSDILDYSFAVLKLTDFFSIGGGNFLASS
jgi:hypothetical protein